ncbi:MAG: VCBS repeat-containing protein [Armatimonadetes bacterium]|nr:VCBS repeat-containing protein [Armatimonadota bacterium]MDE2205009.1 VCBS repeat-containing protein [Armatimonadota bacterium]
MMDSKRSAVTGYRRAGLALTTVAAVALAVLPTIALGQTLSTLHSFTQTFPTASVPVALTQATDGNFYGVSTAGGPGGLGTVFQVTGGTVNVLHTFGGFDGSSPDGQLLQARNGYLYGTTQTGGSDNDGVIFRISLSGTFQVLHNFTGGDGTGPQGALLQLTGGNIVGTAATGGANGQGVVFSMSPTGSYRVIYSFKTGATDGQNPSGGVVLANDLNLYGVTYSGGANGDGSIYSVSSAGTETLVHSFTGADGSNPGGTLLIDGGVMYGTAAFGGALGDGSFFSVTTGHTFTLLYSFGTVANDGFEPSGLVLGTNGKLYGVCGFGGTNGVGTLFSVTTAGVELPAVQFNEASSGFGAPNSDVGLCVATGGLMYGVAINGGTGNLGGVFNSDVNGAVTVVAQFAYNSTDGSAPSGALSLLSDGTLIGLTTGGGLQNSGVLYDTSEQGALTYPYSFASAGGALYNPVGRIALNSSGTKFGMGELGLSGAGGIWALTPAGGFTTPGVFNFTKGAAPTGLITDGTGNLFGTTSEGGASGDGTIFEIPVAGGITILHSFTGATTDGGLPEGNLLLASDGRLYGTTEFGGTNNLGTVYRINTSGGSFTLVHSFAGTDGEYPVTGLFAAADHYLYGATSAGGSGGNGTVFRVTTTLFFGDFHDFASSGLEGMNPDMGLSQAPDGYLYGTTPAGGSAGGGTIYRLDSAGGLTVSHNFSSAVDGSAPAGPLTLAANGDFYGTTRTGGPNSTSAGTLFRLRTQFWDHDFNHDTHPDLIWENTSTGAVSCWFLNGAATLSTSAVTTLPAGFHLFSAVDLNGDGLPDLIYWNSSTGAIEYAQMNGITTTTTGTIFASSNTAWKPITFADVNGDGFLDLLWQNQSTGQVEYTAMTGFTPGATTVLPETIPTTKHLVAAEDLNGDGHPDLIFQDTVANGVVYWLMNGTSVVGQGTLVGGININPWELVGFLDISHTFQPAIIFHNKTTGAVVYYSVNGLLAAPTGFITTSQPTNMEPIAR